MRRLILACLCAVTSLGATDYVLGPDSQVRPGVPKGALTKHQLAPGKIYPGVPHDYQVYVPAKYDASKPTPVMVFLDGSTYTGDQVRVPVVFDNLMAAGQLPPIIGIFVDPGILPVFNEETQMNRYNRTYEYDQLGPRFSRFLLEELIPEVGKSYNLSKDPSDRAISGLSTGAVGAFVAAWERPDQFRRVLSFIGTFVDMKGANTMPFLIRKTEPKPLRIFMQDGTNDLNSGWGSWPLQTQSMLSAFEFSHYDVKLELGDEAHNMKQGGAIMPDALRWLWRDYPAKITVPPPVEGGRAGGRGGLRPSAFNIVYPDRGWERVGDIYKSLAGQAGDAAGNLYFADPASNRIYKSGPDGKVTVFKENTAGAKALKMGPGNLLYASQPGRHRIVAYGADGSEKQIAANVDARDLVVTAKGAVYFTDTLKKIVSLIDATGKLKVVYDGGEIASPTALTLSPDQSLLNVLDAESKFGWSFQVAPDGSLISEQPFWRLEFSEQATYAGIEGIAVDSIGYLYTPTLEGIELSNQIGRVEQILNKPDPTATITHVAFGGADRHWLYAATKDGRLFRRELKRTGVVAWEPVKPPKPGL